MTIIAVKDRIMAADSWSFRNEVGYPLGAADKKIARAPDGSLVAGCGCTLDNYALRQWVRAGMDFKAAPALQYPTSSEDSVDWLWVKPDGTTWRGSADFMVFPVSTPFAIGILSAVLLVEGAMIAGASAEEAVRIAISRCAFVGGELQVEHLIAPKIVTRTYNRCSNCGYCYTEDYRGRECTWCYTLL